MSASSLRPIMWNLLGATLFRFSPHVSHGYRRKLLKLFGARVHDRAKIRRSAKINCPWNLTLEELSIVGDHAMLDCTRPISLGKRSVVSQLAVLTTTMRDPSVADHPVLYAPIQVQDDAWVAADTLVLPGSIVSVGTVVGARSLIEGTTTEPWKVCVGHPVRAIKDRAYFARDASKGALA